MEYRYDIEKKRKRLTQESKGKYMGHDKKLYSKHHGVETYEYVKRNIWENEVASNPNGLTATKAKQAKDPDLNKVEIPVIAINHDAKVPNKIEDGKKGTRVIGQKRTVEQKITNDEEHGKRRGYIPAEEGKGLKKYKMPMLEEDK